MHSAPAQELFDLVLRRAFQRLAKGAPDRRPVPIDRELPRAAFVCLPLSPPPGPSRLFSLIGEKASLAQQEGGGPSVDGRVALGAGLVEQRCVPGQGSLFPPLFGR